jgi:DNA processing protein
VAVLGTGIDSIYPVRHQQLGEQIATRGCLVSEFPPGTPPLPHNFPRRNRIISGLALGVLVVEAALPSGSLITAGTATEQGREVFALPWSIAHTGGAGCLRLLRDGAKMVLCIDDVLEELDPLYPLYMDREPLLREPLLREPPFPEVSTAEDEASPPQLLDLLGYESASVDQLVEASGLSAAEVMSGLSALELAGKVCRCPGGYMRSG